MLFITNSVSMPLSHAGNNDIIYLDIYIYLEFFNDVVSSSD
jgi:hypothetical protein